MTTPINYEHYAPRHGSHIEWMIVYANVIGEAVLAKYVYAVEAELERMPPHSSRRFCDFNTTDNILLIKSICQYVSDHLQSYRIADDWKSVIRIN